jgi:hypothetical protein
MNKSNFGKYHSLDLLPLAERLSADYYNAVAALCEKAEKQAVRLKVLETNGPTSPYTTFCAELLKEVQQYIAPRKDELVPYLQKLAEKSATGHDCRSCKNGCSLQHELKLAELKETHAHLKDLLTRIQMVSLPLYTETIYPDAYRVLRNQIALIENNLTELYFLEEAYLIPKVAEAQKSIYAPSL